jgi:valyl-tRNA synthetase
MAEIQEILGSIRNAKNEAKVAARQNTAGNIFFSPQLRPIQGPALAIINNLTGSLIMAVSTPLEVRSIGGIRGTIGENEYALRIDIDNSLDQKRTEKQRDDLTKQIATLKARQANSAYMAKAPPNLVKQTQDQLAAAEDELAKLG